MQVLLFGCQMRTFFIKSVKKVRCTLVISRSTDTREIHAVTPVHLKFEMLSVTHPQESMNLSL